MSKRILRRVMTASIALGVAALGFTAPTAQAAGASPAAEPLEYVALGDSYSAGSGVLPIDFSSPLCLRSTANYPHVIAERTGAQLTDVTCGGAQTKHFTESQHPGVGPQIEALSAETDLVTLTIGGNDSSTFVNAILSCGTAGVLHFGQGSPCRDQYGSSFEDTIEESTYPALVSALQEVRAKAPNAEVAVLGYPWIPPAASVPSCFVKLPIASGDVPYVRGIQERLNTVVERAAQETGATFVDFAQESEGHDACQPVGTRWIEPVLFGTSLVPVHPNALGEQRMAEHTLRTLGLD